MKTRIIAWIASPLVFFVYMGIVSNGIRNFAPAFQLKLYRLPIPLISILYDWEWSHTLDLAHVMALIMLLMLVGSIANIQLEFFIDSSNKPNNKQKEIIQIMSLVVGGVIFLSDLILFGMGLSGNDSLWNEKPSLFIIIIFTLMYGAILLSTTFYAIRKGE